MRTQCGTFLALLLAGLALESAADEVSATLGGIRLNTVATASPVVVSTAADTDVFVDLPVTYRAGETVTATAPDGESIALVASAAPSAGSVAFEPTAGGLWRLSNSNGETVLVGVAWSVFGDCLPQDFSTAAPFVMHTKGYGPSRIGRARQFPAIAYSGDGWIGNASASAELTFLAPNGTATTNSLSGTGAMPFRFASRGQWLVTLGMEGDRTMEAVVSVEGGFLISVW